MADNECSTPLIEEQQQQHHQDLEEEEENNFGYALQIVDSMAFPMVMNVVIELDILGIIARAGPGNKLLASEIAASLPEVKNPMAASMLDRMLWLLATYNVVTCSKFEAKDGGGGGAGSGGGVVRKYGLAPVAKFFVPDHDGVSLAPLMSLSQDKVFVDCW